jgi:hypothetical protein
MMDYYTIETHGEKGNYALYAGRDNEHHGARLCNLNDFDMYEAETIAYIVKALNAISLAQSIKP